MGYATHSSVPVTPATDLLHEHPPKLTLMQRVARKASRTLRRVPNVPGLLAVALCSAAFWFGRVSISTSLLPEPAGPIINPTTRAGRTLQEKGSEVRLIGGQAAGAVKAAAVTGAALPTINPYDMEAFEAAVSKGLSTLKPPMTPGESGEAFYRTIPFQAGCLRIGQA
ncbi:hypothetical protein GPECTOR_1g751 [Gonium pectorale]|uniref:Uncharacterized protein n=1 Tax=Gonium pectorale TaxID=33097 RepID=A0A150H442_GONPE|nr:hypothetical protein GPECTOR_1g751 [Gonium pectorale]|eukprot:KXZ56833.1 hypothetical protein GPECTOR_1g751 [Gonium pectorale]